ncbi:DUF3299 domain-containing protein [Pontibacterium sp.]|uniref:DUF3299 domain-containing protein n=1 Tax=Pontibacterium sp. TaxID=2036026 RepID=UPI003514EF34
MQIKLQSIFRTLLLTISLAVVLPAQAEEQPAEKPLTFNGEPVQVLNWEELMPADFSLDALLGNPDEISMLDDLDPAATQYMDQMMAALASAPVVPEMDGKMVKVPGFVVPVQGDGLNVTEFFLVPYFGACIHVPPPPSNQIIYVRFEPGTKVENLYDAIWVTGKLETEVTTHELASSGYSLEAFVIEPYEDLYEEPVDGEVQN